MRYVILFGDTLMSTLAIGPVMVEEIKSVLEYLGNGQNVTIIPLRPVKEVVK